MMSSFAVIVSSSVYAECPVLEFDSFPVSIHYEPHHCGESGGAVVIVNDFPTA